LDIGRTTTRIEPVAESWQSLRELEAWALRQGFTQEQFGYAVERVGANPHHVASELQRHLLMATLQDQREAE
jgi:hypothetical protein